MGMLRLPPVHPGTVLVARARDATLGFLCSCPLFRFVARGKPRDNARALDRPVPLIFRFVTAWNLTALPSSQGIPIVHLPCSQTPPGPPRHGRLASWCYPRCSDDEGSRAYHSFEALSHGFCTRCLRFMPPLLTTMQDSLLDGGQPFPGGLDYPQDPDERFLSGFTSISSFLGLFLAPQTS